MSDHNFEKQIRQKLDELKVPPGDRVWSAVELQIRKDKRRRRGFVLYPLLLLLIGGGAYFIFEKNLSSKTSASEYAINSTRDNNSVPGHGDKSIGVEDQKNNEHSSSSAQPPVVTIPQPGVVAGEEEDKVAGAKINNSRDDLKTTPSNEEISSSTFNRSVDKVKPSQSETGSNHISKSNVRIQKKGAAANKGTATPGITARNKNSDGNLTGNNRVNLQDKPLAQPKSNDVGEPSITQSDRKDGTLQGRAQDLPPVASKIPEPLPLDSINNAIVDSDSKVADSSDSNQLVAINTPADSTSLAQNPKDNRTIKKSRQPSFKWGFNGSAGISNLNDGGLFKGIVGGEKSLVADVSPNALNSAPSPTAVIYRPSSIENGFSFSIGAFIQKDISKRFSFSTGVQYRYYSAKIQVGHRVDSVAVLQNAFGSLNVSQYYRSAPVPVTYEYTNRFQFVELPLTANFKVHKRLPVYWNGGLALSYLVSTNALHFDSQTGVYYKDDGLFNKLQANLSTSVTISLFNNSRMPVHVGPQLQYGLTNLMKRDVSAAKHLFFVGLSSKVYLKK